MAALVLGLGGLAAHGAELDCTVDSGKPPVTKIDHEGTADSDDEIFCGFKRCDVPEPAAPFLRLEDPACDALLTVCDVELVVPFEFPGNSENGGQFNHPVIFWFEGAQPPNCDPTQSSGCGDIAVCGGLNGELLAEKIDTVIEIGASCGTLGTGAQRNYSVRAYSCAFDPSCKREKNVPNLDLTPQRLAQFLDCPIPRTEDCNQCNACRTVGPGRIGIGGAPPIMSPADAGPGAMLRYAAGGAGGANLPGTADWTPTLGRYWSHDYAGKVVPDPDDSHVWWITGTAVFREFGNLSGGLYETLAPSDEYRTLERTGTGWLLRDLDGTVTEFEEMADGSGRWLSRSDRKGNPLATATYDTVTGRLAEVAFLDERKELFAYYQAPDPAEGKLESITEVGVDGTTTRTWEYRWSGDDLVGIDRPDGTSWEMTYDAQGFMTLLELVGDDGTSRRVEGAWEYDAEGRVVRTWRGDTSFTGPDAVDTWELSYDSSTQTSVTDPLGQITVYTYEPDPAGGDTVRVTGISGPCPGCGLESDTQFLYGADHPLLPIQQTDALNHRTDFVYDAQGQMVSRTDAVATAEQRTTTWDYNPTYPGLVTEITRPSVAGDPDGRVTSILRDAQGYPTTRREDGFEDGAPFGPLDTVTTFTGEGQVETIDPPGFGSTDVTSFTYDGARGGVVIASRTDPLVGSTTFEHDAFNRRTRTTDPNGTVTETEYDELDRVRFVRQLGATPSDTSDDLVTEHVYGTFGDLDHTVLPEGNIIAYTYDAAGRLLAIERRPDLATPGERVLYHLDAAGNRTREEHQVWDGATSTWVTESFTDYLFTSRCHLDEIQHADGTVTEYAYDCNGNLEKVWDANHPSSGQTAPATATYSYDALDRLTTVTRPWAGAGGGNAITTYAYNAQDHLTSVTDAEGNETTYVYSDRDLLTEEISPVSGTTTHAYNAHGALVTTTDARGVTVTRTVDELDRVTFVDFPDDTLDTDHVHGDEPGAPAVPFSLGRLVALTRDGTSVDYAYDQYGRTTQDGGLGYGYDANGNRTGITYPDGVAATYGFDFADRQASLSVTTPAGITAVVTAASYLPSGPLAGLTFGTGAAESRVFDQRYFPASIALDAAEDRTWTYTNDAVGNVTEIVSTRACAGDLLLFDDTVTDARVEDSCAAIEAGPSYTVDTGADVTFRAATRVVLKDGFSVQNGALFSAGVEPSLSGDVTRSYAYQDVDYFLTDATGPWGTKSWTFDNIGNRLTETDADGTDTYTYTPSSGGGNTALLKSIALPTLGTRDFQYSPAGHQTQVAAGANVIDFSYDDASRLELATRSTDPPTSTPFLYDGRSFLRHAGDLSTTGTVEPLYDSAGLLHGLLRQASAADPQTRYLIFHVANRPVAQLALETGQPDRWWYLTTDHLGTPLVATDGTGDELWENRFEPFGRDMDQGLPWSALESEMFLRFPGQLEAPVWQEATIGAEVVYNLYRWYVPTVGAYTRSDPFDVSLQMNGADPRSLEFAPGVVAQLDTLRDFDLSNRDAYLYAKANPLYWADPLGLKPCSLSPDLIGCKGPGTGCCIAACIDELRVSFCSWRQMRPWITAAGALIGSLAGAGVGLGAGGPFGACIGGGVGLVFGGLGGYLGFDAVVPTEAFRQTFKNCANNHCGVRCEPEKPCFVDNLFTMVLNE